MTDEEAEHLATEDMAEMGIGSDWMEHAVVMFPRPWGAADYPAGP